MSPVEVLREVQDAIQHNALVAYNGQTWVVYVHGNVNLMVAVRDLHTIHNDTRLENINVEVR